MTAPNHEPVIVEGGLAVSFVVRVAGRNVSCTLSRAVLEHYFWLQNGAGDEQMLRTFANGRRRITAIAERKALRHSAASVRLDELDFSRQHPVSLDLIAKP